MKGVQTFPFCFTVFRYRKNQKTVLYFFYPERK